MKSNDLLKSIKNADEKYIIESKSDNAEEFFEKKNTGNIISRIAAVAINRYAGRANRLHVVTHRNIFVRTFGLRPRVLTVVCLAAIPSTVHRAAVVIADNITCCVQIFIDIDVRRTKTIVCETAIAYPAGTSHQCIECAEEVVAI